MATATLPTSLFRCALVIACLFICGCAIRLYEPAPDLSIAAAEEPWYVNCEAAISRVADPNRAPGVRMTKWLPAKDRAGSIITLAGGIEDGFFVFDRVIQGELADKNASGQIDIQVLRAACISTMGQIRGGEANELVSVRTFRKSEGVNLAIYFGPKQHQSRIRKLVVFSDSLSDSGKLKQRLRVLPGSPYWAGRFSNGPNWIDYLEAWSGLPVQNHSFGGASVTGPENISRQNLYALIHDGGQYFVSGSIDHQIDDYENRFLRDNSLLQVEDTAFLMWTGSNDYISKEPFSGAIDTLLNHPLENGGYQAVVEAVIQATLRQLERIYALGARYILIANLPDLGATPIVLQNKTYGDNISHSSDAERRLALAHRLSALSRYHNEGLKKIVAEFKTNRPDVEIVEFDADLAFTELLRDKLPDRPESETFKPGFSPGAQGVLVQGENSSQLFQGRCYQGGYFGSSIPGNVCSEVDKVIFWDVIHPTTYAHCWTAYLFGELMNRTGWIDRLPPLDRYKTWCQGISRTMLGHGQIEDILSPVGLQVGG